MKKLLLGLVLLLVCFNSNLALANSYTVNDIAFLMELQRTSLAGERKSLEANSYIKNLPCRNDNGVYVNRYSGNIRDIQKMFSIGDEYKFVCIDEKTYLKPNISYHLKYFYYPLSENFKEMISTEKNIEDMDIRKIISENDNEEIKKILTTIDVRYLLTEDYNGYKNGDDSGYGYFIYKLEKNKENKYYKLIISNIENYVKNNVPIIKIENSDDSFLSEDIKKDIEFYNNTFIETPLLQLSEKVSNTNKKTKKRKFKQFMNNVNTILGTETIEDIQAELNAPYIRRQKMLDNYNFQLSQIEQRAYNTAMLNLNLEADNETMKQKLINTDKKADLLYENFIKNPNDIKSNHELIKIIGIAKGEYSSYINKIQSNINEMYNIYVQSYKLQKEYLNLPEFDGTVRLYYENPLLEGDKFLTYLNNNVDASIYGMMQEKIEKYDKIAEEVSTYSYNYEEKKYKNWLAKNGKKQIKGALEQFVYASHYQPQMGSLYIHHPTNNLFLKVLQTVPGGVILTGTYIGGNIYGQNTIFLQTTKSFADGQIIREPITAEFKGYYDYTTVLGARKRIYKFYRLGQKEIEANFKVSGEKFYFYEIR